jgi:hypothetical protein
MLIPRPTLSTSIWGAPGTSLSLAHQDRAQKGGHLFFACLWRTFHMESLRTGIALDISADALARHTRPLVSSLYRTAVDCRNLSANQPLFLRNDTERQQCANERSLGNGRDLAHRGVAVRTSVTDSPA